MAGRSGALVVADVSSGKILAAVELERAAHEMLTPGSTVKPFVLMELLATGKLDPNEKLLCRRKVRIVGVRMDCTHPASAAELDAEEAIAYSCNSYFVQAATRLSAGELVQALRRAGLDAPTGLVGSEATGHIAMPGDRDALQLEALGDRGIEVTPLELLEAYRRLALRKESGDSEGDAPVFAGLEGSVAYGMAGAANIREMKVAGKTGTAASRESPRTHGLFVGYAPAEKPRIAMVVLLQNGRGTDAAAVAQSVFAAFARNGQAR